MPSPLLNINGISKIYYDQKKEVKALNNVSLTVERGRDIWLTWGEWGGKNNVIIYSCNPSSTNHR